MSPHKDQASASSLHAASHTASHTASHAASHTAPHAASASDAAPDTKDADVIRLMDRYYPYVAAGLMSQVGLVSLISDTLNIPWSLVQGVVSAFFIGLPIGLGVVVTPGLAIGGLYYAAAHRGEAAA